MAEVTVFENRGCYRLENNYIYATGYIIWSPSTPNYRRGIEWRKPGENISSHWDSTYTSWSWVDIKTYGLSVDTEYEYRLKVQEEGSETIHYTDWKTIRTKKYHVVSYCPYGSFGDPVALDKYSTDYNAARDATSGRVRYFTFWLGQFLSGSWKYIIREALVYLTDDIIPEGVESAYIWCDTAYTADVFPTLLDAAFDAVLQYGGGIYPHNPAVGGDYNRANYSGDGGRFSFNTADVLYAFRLEFNAEGLTWIANPSTHLMLRSSRDISGIAPTGLENMLLAWDYLALELKPPVCTIIDSEHMYERRFNFHCNVSSHGGRYIDKVGIAYNLTPTSPSNPQTNPKTELGDFEKEYRFSYAGRTYYVWACAHQDGQYGYSSNYITILTPIAVDIDVWQGDYHWIYFITYVTAGQTTVLERGIEYYEDGDEENVQVWEETAEPGTHYDFVTPLKSGTKYWYRFYARGDDPYGKIYYPAEGWSWWETLTEPLSVENVRATRSAGHLYLYGEFTGGTGIVERGFEYKVQNNEPAAGDTGVEVKEIKETGAFEPEEYHLSSWDTFNDLYHAKENTIWWFRA